MFLVSEAPHGIIKEIIFMKGIIWIYASFLDF